jgi:hypothetical protein
MLLTGHTTLKLEYDKYLSGKKFNEQNKGKTFVKLLTHDGNHN